MRKVESATNEKNCTIFRRAFEPFGECGENADPQRLKAALNLDGKT